MNTKDVPHPFRKRIKRARRKLAAADRRPGAAPFGNSTTALRAARKATMAHQRLTSRIAELGDVEPPDGYVERAMARARAAGVLK